MPVVRHNPEAAGKHDVFAAQKCDWVKSSAAFVWASWDRPFGRSPSAPCRRRVVDCLCRSVKEIDLLVHTRGRNATQLTTGVKAITSMRSPDSLNLAKIHHEVLISFLNPLTVSPTRDLGVDTRNHRNSRRRRGL